MSVQYSYNVLYANNIGVFRYLVHVPAAEVLHSGVCVAALMFVILTVLIAVPVVAPTPVMGLAGAAKGVAAVEVISVTGKYNTAEL